MGRRRGRGRGRGRESEREGGEAALLEKQIGRKMRMVFTIHVQNLEIEIYETDSFRVTQFMSYSYLGQSRPSIHVLTSLVKIVETNHVTIGSKSYL